MRLGPWQPPRGTSSSPVEAFVVALASSRALGALIFASDLGTLKLGNGDSLVLRIVAGLLGSIETCPCGLLFVISVAPGLAASVAGPVRPT